MIKHRYGAAVPGVGGTGPDDFSDNDSTPLQNSEEYTGSRRTASETKGWNVFRDPLPKAETGSNADQKCLELTLKIIKVIVYLVVFVVVLGCGVVAMSTILLMTSQLQVDRTILYCNRRLGTAKTFIVALPEAQRIAWTWCIIFAFAVPEIGTLLRSIRFCLFKSWEKPSPDHLIIIGMMETFHVIGLAIIFISILPDLDVIQGVMLTSCVCFVPGLLALLSRNKKRDESKRFFLVLVDLAALAAQATAFVVWPVLNNSHPALWVMPVALVLVSCGWWENYVSVQSPLILIRSLARVKEDMKVTRYYVYAFVSVWKIIVFVFSSVAILFLKGNDVTHLFTMFGTAFNDHNITVNEVQSVVGGGTIPDLSQVLPDGVTVIKAADFSVPLWVLLIQVISAYCAYVFGKFACKMLIQGFSYALPVNLTIPVTISLLIAASALRDKDPCFFNGIIPDYLFYSSPVFSVLKSFILEEYTWVWLLWFLSQTWVTLHIWTPKCERLASTDKLFVTPMYNGLLINQSMALNRNRDDQPEVIIKDESDVEREKSDSEDDIVYDRSGNPVRPPSIIKKSDIVTKIYACATMWHETKDEMLDFLKSILRLDLDQCARKNAQDFLNIVDPDYYEFETHIFFDDAFEISDHDDNESQVNPFVKLLVNVLDAAASDIHHTRMQVRAPKKYPTPYGGRLVWTLPGNTKMIAHLKDKSKIRHRKRWSQVMYMYYLLGHRIMDLPIGIQRKEVIAENTFLLTLDGDIDFQPSAVKRLVDLMKKNPNLGAACGRVHPVGSGPMVWYQMFEYAIGHWLQKATEHMIGCVLCSPGCFSLFRAKALMDDSVMRKYTSSSNEAIHYVQYDQGEDRWLCTLLLQRGYRVEYSAASDAYTHAPEGFNEFYNQRRRWVPSTMANIMDLLLNYKRTVKNNDNISTPYMCYQVLLMVGTILGPGTIFLMLVGAFVAAFQIGIMTSFYYNVIPVLIFIVVCLTCKSDVQLFVASIISTIYGLVMMAVIVGIVIQMADDGWVAPSSLFLFLVVGQLVIAGFMHPQELICLPCGIIYYVTIPSMYLLLVVYSITNLNNVTWGTREVRVKKTLAELEEDKKAAEESKNKTNHKSFLGLLHNSRDKTNDNDHGSIEFSLAGLCRCMFCTHGKPSDEKLQLVVVADCLEQVMKRLDTMDIRDRSKDPQRCVAEWKQSPSMASRFIEQPMTPIDEIPASNERPDSDTETTGSQNTEANRKRTFLVSPYWLDDEGLKKGEVDFLSTREEQFWEDMIEEYLFPIDEDKAEKARIAGDLKRLRDTSSFAFFMLNALFVLIIFLMQLNQDVIYIQWPLGVKHEISFDETALEVHITHEYLRLEPIGLVFVIFFGLILVIQFTAMLFHRFGTFSHIVASTTLQGSYCCKKPEDLSGTTLQSKDAIEIVKEFQRLDGTDSDYVETTTNRPGRRKTVRNLEMNRRKTKKVNNNLDEMFRERFFSMSEGSGLSQNLPRKSNKAFKAFEARRTTVIEERKKSQVQTMGSKWEDTLSMQPGPSRDSQISVGEGFERHPSGIVNLAYEPEESHTESHLELKPGIFSRM